LDRSRFAASMRMAMISSWMERPVARRKRISAFLLEQGKPSVMSLGERCVPQCPQMRSRASETHVSLRRCARMRRSTIPCTGACLRTSAPHAGDLRSKQANPRKGALGSVGDVCDDQRQLGLLCGGQQLEDDARQKLHLEAGPGTHFGSYLAGKIAGVDWRTTFRLAWVAAVCAGIMTKCLKMCSMTA
jgi:hypothetical protein